MHSIASGWVAAAVKIKPTFCASFASGVGSAWVVVQIAPEAKHPVKATAGNGYELHMQSLLPPLRI